MFNDISWGSRDIEKVWKSNARLVSVHARRFGAGQWSFLGPGSEKKWYSLSADSPQGEWDRMAEKMMLEFGDFFFCWHQKKNYTCFRKVTSHVTNWTIFFDCWTSWFSRCFTFEQKAKCHVKESGFGSGETETDEFGVEELLERKENPPQDSSASNSPGNQELDQSHACFTQRQETDVNDLNNVDFILSNVQSSHQAALLCVFEDNEAVIKMIIKGRSPTMRHVSRTHRVALDWSFDRINLDSKIQIKYIETKNQLADILTKGNFTRDEWNHLLSLFNISHFSSTVCKGDQRKKSDETCFQNPQELLLIGCLIVETWTLRSKSNTLTPETNLLTVSREMSGITSWVCSRQRVSRCILVANSEAFSLRIRERIVIGASKRGQDTTSSDGSPVAKSQTHQSVATGQCKEDVSPQRPGSLVNLENEDDRKKELAWLRETKFEIPKWTDKGRFNLAHRELGQKDLQETWCYTTQIQKPDFLKWVDIQNLVREDQNQTRKWWEKLF